jgi:hypothetical protein
LFEPIDQVNRTAKVDGIDFTHTPDQWDKSLFPHLLQPPPTVPSKPEPPKQQQNPPESSKAKRQEDL